MGRYLKVILLVIAITLPGYVLSVEPSKDGNHPPPDQPQTPTPSVPKSCSETSLKYKEAAEALRQAIQDVLKNAVEAKEQNVTKTLMPKAEAYLVAAEECNNDTTLHNTLNHTIFVELMEFVVHNRTILKEFVDKKQGECILNNMENIKNCDTSSAYKDSQKSYSAFFDLTKLKFNELTCGHAMSLKNCTVNVLQQNCKPTVDFVSSLFDHMQDHCPKKPGSVKDLGSGSVRMTASWVGFIVFVVEFIRIAIL